MNDKMALQVKSSSDENSNLSDAIAGPSCEKISFETNSELILNFNQQLSSNFQRIKKFYHKFNSFTSKTIWKMGRSKEADIIIADVGASRNHALIQWDSQFSKWFLVDEKSANGIFYNEQHITEGKKIEIENNSTISLRTPNYKFIWNVSINQFSQKNTDAEPPLKKRKTLSCTNSNQSEPQEVLVTVINKSQSDEKENLQIQKKSELSLEKSVDKNSPLPSTSFDCQEANEKENVQNQKKSELILEKPVDKNSPLPSTSFDCREANERENEQNQKKSDSMLLVEKMNEKINNMKTKMNEELSCSICNEIFIMPYSMPCGHIFCKYCLDQWKKHCNSRQYDCPNCREKVKRQKISPSIYVENLISAFMQELDPEMLEERKQLVEKRKAEHDNFLQEQEMKKAQPSQSRRGGARGRRRQLHGIERFLENYRGNQDDDVNTDVDNDQEVIDLTSDTHETDQAQSTSDDQTNTTSSPQANDFDTSENSESEEIEGESSVYYGGYGRCYKCGHRGHWANGCPF